MRSLKSFFPTIAVLRHRRVGVGFLQAGIIRGGLLVGGIDASGRGVEKPPYALGPRDHQQVRIDQHAEHAERLVVFDESHSSHVGRQVVAILRSIERLPAGRLVLEIEHEVLGLREFLMPLRDRLAVHDPDAKACSSRVFAKWPPMKPPPPHTTISLGLLTQRSEERGERSVPQEGSGAQWTQLSFIRYGL
ncbi:MAG: hypothetical protein WDM96_15410 [Lacunisphaera sp.]